MSQEESSSSVDDLLKRLLSEEEFQILMKAVKSKGKVEGGESDV